MCSDNINSRSYHRYAYRLYKQSKCSSGYTNTDRWSNDYVIRHADSDERGNTYAFSDSSALPDQ